MTVVGWLAYERRRWHDRHGAPAVSILTVAVLP